MSHNYVVMGVCGSGKSTIGRLLAERTGKIFIEGDEYHPENNVSKMSQGEPLTDADREAWLNHIVQEIQTKKNENAMGLIVSCSALKMKYRDKLRGADSELFFLHLHGSENTLSERLIRRQSHFMKANLLKSQLETLEMPRGESKYGVPTMKFLTYVYESSQLIKKQSRIY